MKRASITWMLFFKNILECQRYLSHTVFWGAQPVSEYWFDFFGQHQLTNQIQYKILVNPMLGLNGIEQISSGDHVIDVGMLNIDHIQV
jgi:hypothetical protein